MKKWSVVLNCHIRLQFSGMGAEGSVPYLPHSVHTDTVEFHFHLKPHIQLD